MGEPGWSIGTFAWRELATDDGDGARRFHGELFGWTWHKVVNFGTGTAPGGGATVLTARGTPVADVQPAPAGSRARWATYVEVQDADASRDLAVRLGGRVLVPRIDVPRVGVVAAIADPGGAALGLLQRR